MYTLAEFLYNKCYYGGKVIVLSENTSQKDLKFILKECPKFKGISYKEKVKKEDN